jgi:hypothetical protein
VNDFGPDAHGRGFSRPGSAHEPVGSVGEEAAKLLAALQGWARDHVADYSRSAGEFGSSHIADGSAACRICPLCQLIAWVRSVNPESVDQLGHAAGSMLQALSGLVDAAHRSGERRGSPVEKIDLADESGDGPEESPWH